MYPGDVVQIIEPDQEISALANGRTTGICVVSRYWMAWNQVCHVGLIYHDMIRQDTYIGCVERLDVDLYS